MVDFHFIVMCSFFIIGLNYATDYDEGQPFKNNSYKNILWFLKYKSIELFGEYWTKPLFSCVICMASFWTTILYFIFIFLFTDHYNILTWLVSIVVVAGLNRVLKSFL